jgi:hypothetical protein
VVQKYGRTTGHTTSVVTELRISVDVCYVPAGPVGCKKSARFVDQIGIGDGTFSAGGDSGSLIVDMSNNPVALLFAGSSARTLANPIDLVLSRFGVTIDSGPPPPPNDAPVVTISSPSDGSEHNSGATINFTGTVTDTEDDDGIITASLSWSSDIDGVIGSGGNVNAILSDGVHLITASATDDLGKTGSASVSITVGDPPAEATTVGVDSVTLITEGGKNGDKHLSITYLVQDNFGDAVAGAVVDITLNNNTGSSWTGSATTGANGTVTFTLKNAPGGCYTTVVTDVTATGLDWDGVTNPLQLPDDPFCK